MRRALLFRAALLTVIGLTLSTVWLGRSDLTVASVGPSPEGFRASTPSLGTLPADLGFKLGRSGERISDHRSNKQRWVPLLAVLAAAAFVLTGRGRHLVPGVLIAPAGQEAPVRAAQRAPPSPLLVAP